MVSLGNSEGQVSLNSAFYVERSPIKVDCYEAILQPGALIRIKAPRQMGKTYLMSRVLHHATQHDYQIASDRCFGATLTLNFLSDTRVI